MQTVEFKKLDEFAPMQAFYSKWPYTAFSGLKNEYIMILNAYNLDKIHRVLLPENPDKVCHTYITETNNLYVVTQKDDKYLYQYIDLDR